MGICALPTADKQLVARRVGSDLVKKHGKRPYYTVEQVKASARQQNIPEAWDCWALSLYTSPNDFVDHHMTIGESCDYGVMHGKMVDAVTADSALPDIAHHFNSGVGLSDIAHHSDNASVLPDVVHHSSGGADTSWFSDLLDALGSIDLPDFF